MAAIFDRLQRGGATVLALRDPVVLEKAIKNAAEAAGHRAASVRDGVALTRFLKWCEETPQNPKTPSLDYIHKYVTFVFVIGEQHSLLSGPHCDSGLMQI